MCRCSWLVRWQPPAAGAGGGPAVALPAAASASAATAAAGTTRNIRGPPVREKTNAAPYNQQPLQMGADRVRPRTREQRRVRGGRRRGTGEPMGAYPHASPGANRPNQKAGARPVSASPSAHLVGDERERVQ